MKNDDKKDIIFVCLPFIILAIIGLFVGSLLLYCNINKEKKMARYENQKVYCVQVITGSGRAKSSYFGVISEEDYRKWENGESGSVWINKLMKENYGTKLNINGISSIIIYNKDDFLPLSFVF